MALFSFRGGVKSHKCVATVARHGGGGGGGGGRRRTNSQQCEHVSRAADAHISAALVMSHCGVCSRPIGGDGERERARGEIN